MKKGLLLVALAAVMLTAGCTDAERSKMFNLGGSASVDCYSGTLLIYSGRSTGKVISEANSDGYAFRDKADGELKEVSGNCIINYGK